MYTLFLGQSTNEGLMSAFMDKRINTTIV